MLGIMKEQKLTPADRSRLRYNVLLEALTDREFDTILPDCTLREFAAGETILKEETHGEEMYFLVEGRVKMARPITGGGEQLLGILHAGDCFGAMEVISGRPRVARVSALDACTTYALPGARAEELFRRSPAFSRRLLEVFSVRLRSLTNQFIQEVQRQLVSTAGELRRRELLIEASRKVNSTLDLEELLDIILEMALRMVDGERGTVFLVDDAAGELWTKTSRAVADGARVTIRLPIGKGISGTVAATGDTINIPDAYLDPRVSPEFDRTTGFRTRAILCMPLRNKDGKIIGVFQLLNKRGGEAFTADDAAFLDALSVHAALAIENARLVAQEREKIRIEGELRAAREVQMGMLPKTLPLVAGYEFAAATLPAREVAGDLHDFLALDPTRLAIFLGDVSGKGLPAALLMAHVQATLRDQAHAARSVGGCVAETNRLLVHTTGAEKFVTLFYGELDTRTHRFRSTNAGHEQPFLLHRSGAIERLETGGLILGILEDAPAVNAAGERFGEDRLRVVLETHREHPPDVVQERILAAVRMHVGETPQADDMTLVIARRTDQ
jgi:sigma-B regulation protein RsbU (phosphoserine phosphatase)